MSHYEFDRFVPVHECDETCGDEPEMLKPSCAEQIPTAEPAPTPAPVAGGEAT